MVPNDSMKVMLCHSGLLKNYIGATDLGSNLEPNRMRRLYIQFSTFYFLNEFDSIEPKKLVIFCYTLVYWRTDVGEDRKIKVLVFFCVIDLRWKFYIFLLQVFFMLVASFNGLYFYVLRTPSSILSHFISTFVLLLPDRDLYCYRVVYSLYLRKQTTLEAAEYWKL